MGTAAPTQPQLVLTAGSAEPLLRHQQARLIQASVAMAIVFSGGTLGYWWLTDGAYSFVDCAYMTVVTLSTVGYEEAIPVLGHPDRQAFTMGLLFTGMGAIFYFASAMAAFIIEGDLFQYMRRRRMERQIEALTGHFVVVGAGRSGRVAVRKLLAQGHTVVAVDASAEALHAVVERPSERLHLLEGDATTDAVLASTGVARAQGVMVALPDDRDALYVTFTVRQMSPSARIVTRSISHPRKIAQAGADAVVALNDIGGARMVSEMLRPRVTNFIDRLLYDYGGLEMGEVVVGPQCALIDAKLGDAALRERANVLIVAARPAGEDRVVYNPGPALVFKPGMVLIVLGEQDEVDKLARLLDAPTGPAGRPTEARA